MKVRIHVSIAMIALIVVLSIAGCLEPTGTAVNITPEPTPEPCETCTVPEDFCGPPEVCPGEPIKETYAFTDKNVYRIGEVVEFGIVNCGDEREAFGNPYPWWIERWVTNASGVTPQGNCGDPVVGNHTGGMWETIGINARFHTGETVYLNPGENWTERWNTTDWWETARVRGDPVKPFRYRMRSDGSSYQISDDPLVPGIYRVWYDNSASKEFELSMDSFDLQTYRAKALEHVSAREGIPVGELTIINEAFATFPLTGRTFWGAKILDEKSSAVYGVYLDEEGKVADIDAAKEAEAAEKSERYGKLDPELADRVATMRSDEKVVIWVWLTEPSGTTYATHAAPVIDFLEAQNATVVYVSQYAPVVFAEVSRETIRDLGERSDVVSMDITQEYEPAIPA